MQHAPLKFLLVPSLLLSLCACSGLSTTRAPSDPGTTQNQGGQPETYDNPNYYYLFDDILIPNGMDHDADDDFSFDTQQFKAGIQHFSGRVVFDDLINFFQNNMIKDGWRKVTAVRSKKSMLVFEKSSKAAIIELEDGFKAKATVFALEYKPGAGNTDSSRQTRPPATPGASSGAASQLSSSSGAYHEQDIH